MEQLCHMSTTSYLNIKSEKCIPDKTIGILYGKITIFEIQPIC